MVAFLGVRISDNKNHVRERKLVIVVVGGEDGTHLRRLLHHDGVLLQPGGNKPAPLGVNEKRIFFLFVLVKIISHFGKNFHEQVNNFAALAVGCRPGNF